MSANLSYLFDHEGKTINIKTIQTVVELLQDINSDFVIVHRGDAFVERSEEFASNYDDRRDNKPSWWNDTLDGTYLEDHPTFVVEDIKRIFSGTNFCATIYKNGEMFLGED